jgi:hypothetical protein
VIVPSFFAPRADLDQGAGRLPAQVCLSFGRDQLDRRLGLLREARGDRAS